MNQTRVKKPQRAYSSRAWLFKRHQSHGNVFQHSFILQRHFGGKWSNILLTFLSSSLMFLLELLERVPLADPRQIKFLFFASKMSTTKVPTLYVSTVVVASPNPPQRQPLPNPL